MEHKYNVWQVAPFRSVGPAPAPAPPPAAHGILAI